MASADLESEPKTISTSIYLKESGGESDESSLTNDSNCQANDAVNEQDDSAIVISKQDSHSESVNISHNDISGTNNNVETSHNDDVIKHNNIDGSHNNIDISHTDNDTSRSDDQSTGDPDKVLQPENKVNGIKTETFEEKEQKIKSRPLHVDAKSWPFVSDNENNSEKRLSTNLPYTYGLKSGIAPHGTPKYNNTNLAKRHYENSSLCQTSSAPGNVNTNCHATGKNEHVVLLHVNPGETISFYMSDHTQHIQGPATVRMVSCNSTPPMPVPVQVPPGHMVQQLADENWTLREIILSPQPPVAVPVGSPYTAGSSFGSPSTAAPAGPLPYYVYPHISYPPHMQYHAHMQPGITNHTMHTGHIPPHHSAAQGTNGQGQYASVNSPLTMHKDERTQKQFFKLKKRLEARQKDGTTVRSDGASRNDNAMKNATTEYVQDKRELSTDQTKIYEFLSAVVKPNVSEITGRSALASWSPPTLESEKAELPEDIKIENILYNLLISDKAADSAKRVAYHGNLLEYQLTDLKPGSSYYLSLQAILNEVCGKSSEAANFRTAACKPETPQPPKLQSRTKTSLSLKWNAATDNGLKIQNYILEYDEGQGEETFVEIFNGLQKQYKAVKLKTSTCYKFRLAAENELGKSDFCEAVCFSTSGSVPSQPSPPEVVSVKSNSISCKWEMRPNDDSFTLQLEAENSLHGFLPVYNGKDTSYTCGELKRNCQYKLRLCANNEEGSSLWSQIAVVSTLPEAPICPGRPASKGKVLSSSFRVTWDRPKDDGGSPVTSYELELDKGTGFENVYSGPELEFLCDHLKPGTIYFLRTRCKSEGGISPYCDPSCIHTMPVVPGQCQVPRLVGKPKATYLHVKWGSSDDDGGSEVLEYEVEITNPDFTKRQVYKGPGTDCVIAGLLPGRQYAACVRANNKVGHGPYSEAFEVMTGAGTPDVPKDVQAVPRSPHSIFVSWAEPPSNGASITDYRLEVTFNGNLINSYNGLQPSTEVKNLSPATFYSFRAQAFNSVGPGQFTEMIKCQTPSSSPSSILASSIKTVSRATSVALSWAEPNDHGSHITSYNVEIGDSISTSVDKPEISVEGLAPETTYRVRIQAVNGIGLGPFTSLKALTRGLPPNPPLLECSGYTHNSLRLKWGDGKNPEFIQYTLEMFTPHAGSFSPVYQGVGHCHKISRLDECTEYEFRIFAANSEGNGPHSDIFSFTTLKAVPPSPKSPKVSAITETTCSIDWLPSKSIGDDMVSYKLQLGSKNYDYSVAYSGIQTNFVLRGLKPGTEYSVRVAAVRHCKDGSGELNSPFSPSCVFCTSSPVSKQQAPKAASVMSTWADREPLKDQQWAIIILCGFTVFAISIAILTQWILSHQNS